MAKNGPPPKKKNSGPSLASTIFNMDLWKDRNEDNDYGARSKKQGKFGWGKVGKINEGKSYVPAGLTASQYNSLRGKEKVRATSEASRKGGVLWKYRSERSDGVLRMLLRRHF